MTGDQRLENVRASVLKEISDVEEVYLRTRNNKFKTELALLRQRVESIFGNVSDPMQTLVDKASSHGRACTLRFDGKNYELYVGEVSFRGPTLSAARMKASAYVDKLEEEYLRDEAEYRYE